MKLARIEHIRCDEQDGITYVMAPDDTDEDKLQVDVTAARDLYFKALDDFKAQGDHPGWVTAGDDWPDDTTIGEIKRLIKENGEARAAYNNKRSALIHQFGYYLEKFGYTPLWRYEDVLEATAYWGHAHGVSIKYSAPQVDFTPPEGEEAKKPEVYPLKRKALI